VPRTLSLSDKVEIYRFSPLVLILAPLLALVIQTYLPLHFSVFGLLDLPLLVVIYFGLTRRSPVGGLLTGAAIGMAQDALSRGPIGLLGSVNTVIGYVTSFVSVQFTVEHRGVRAITIFVLYYLHAALLYLFGSLMLGQPAAWGPDTRVVAALVNTLSGVLLFDVLDRFRKPA
jgi:rod shape-determining protein MreD